MPLPICKGITQSGKRCSFKGRHYGYCKTHAHPNYLRDLSKKMGECPVCYENITSKTSITTRCKHVFHNACLERWMETSQTCPMCRGDIHTPPPHVPQRNIRANIIALGTFINQNAPIIVNGDVW